MADLTDTQRHHVMQKARGLGLVEMTWHGGWQLTRDGRDLLDLIDELRELDDRPGAVRPSAPRRQAPATRRSGAATPPTGSRPGDDGRAARAAPRKRT